MYGQQDRSLIVRAPAKLNFHLEILGKRPDGFHELETLMVKLALHDTLSLSLRGQSSDSRDITFECHFAASLLPASSKSPTPVPVDDSNLVLKAAKLLQEYSCSTSGAHLVLTKRIPIEAGMGGGSSDAAATLLGLNQLWQLNLNITELEQLAAQLGSDVPFFIRSHTAAICRGRGEKIEPVSVRTNFPIVVVQPETGLSTPQVFQNWKRESETRSVHSMHKSFESGNRFGIINSLHNALQKPASMLNAQVRHVLHALNQMSLPGVLMTGSGSACFALCHTGRQAAYISSLFNATRKYRVYITSLHP